MRISFLEFIEDFNLHVILYLLESQKKVANIDRGSYIYVLMVVEVGEQ